MVPVRVYCIPAVSWCCGCTAWHPARGAAEGSTLRSSLTISSSELLPSSDASMSSVRSAGVPYLDVLDETGNEEVDECE